MDKREVLCYAKLRPDYFSVNVSVLAVTFRRKIFKKTTILPEIVGFLKFVSVLQQLVR